MTVVNRTLGSGLKLTGFGFRYNSFKEYGSRSELIKTDPDLT